jgi:hypothetical protein
MPVTALQHFHEDIARARAIVAHADSLPRSAEDALRVRPDLLRSAWILAVGALDAYFCDAYVRTIFQRRHDCVHNCDRPRVSPQPLDKGGTVLKVIQDIEFLVNRCDEHVNVEFREFLIGVSCSAATIARAGY